MTTAIGANGIEQVRGIVRDKQYRKVKGTMVDLYTASVIVQVYDRVDDRVRDRLLELPVRQVAAFCMKCVK